MCTEGWENERFVLISRGSKSWPTRRCSHFNKLGHIVDFFWKLHPERENMREKDYKNATNKIIGAVAIESSEIRDQVKERSVLQVNREQAGSRQREKFWEQNH